MQIVIVDAYALISDAVHPRRFYVGNGLDFVWLAPVEEEIPWEIFRGRLLDGAHTRQSRRFLAWKVHVRKDNGLSAEPLLSVKWDKEAGEIHVVRAILSFVWEGYHAGNNVIESRETTKWVRELVGTATAGEDVAALVQAAVRGTSRLPLTSLEAPLPAFSLGQLAYLDSAHAAGRSVSFASWREIVDAWSGSPPSWSDLEAVLRAADLADIPEIAQSIGGRSDVTQSLWKIFQHVSLSPYTGFVANALALLEQAVRLGHASRAGQVNFLRRMVILLNRHLTAYDLITYHHRGANYPDALLLDSLLTAFLDLIERYPELDCPPNRTALRQACLLRRYYQDLPVPEAPVSPGENARVLPPPHVRVPEAQLTNIAARTRRLYEGELLPPRLGAKARQILRKSADDLSASDSWQEMGLALFIDRPLGWDIPVGAPDNTPLISHLAFSPSIARRRYAQLLELLGQVGLELDRGTRGSLDKRFAEELTVPGVPIGEIAEPPKPCVSLADASRVAADFVVVRTNLTAVLKAWLRKRLPPDCSCQELKDVVLVRVRRNGGSALALFDGAHERLACVSTYS